MSGIIFHNGYQDFIVKRNIFINYLFTLQIQGNLTKIKSLLPLFIHIIKNNDNTSDTHYSRASYVFPAFFSEICMEAVG